MLNGNLQFQIAAKQCEDGLPSESFVTRQLLLTLASSHIPHPYGVLGLFSEISFHQPFL